MQTGNIIPQAKALFWLTGLLFFFHLAASVADNAPIQGKHVYKITISGNIDPGMAAFLKRSLQDIPDEPGSLIVIMMDTYGGRVDAALEMVDALLAVKQAQTIAFVTNKAISAGALVSLACNRLVMMPSSTIGDCAPIMYASDGPKMMGEKFQSPLRAKFRTLARRNAYPTVLAEAMVSDDQEIFRIIMDGKERFIGSREYDDLSQENKNRISKRETILAKGQLLTMDDTEAKNLGFSSFTAQSLDDLLAKMHVQVAEKTAFSPSWSEKMVGFVGGISTLLMLIGISAIYTEIKSPGFGVPGIVGIVCLGLVFFHQHLVGLASYTELIFLLAGAVLLGFEIFVIPGFGLAGIAAIMCLGIGLLLGFQDFVLPDPNYPWQGELMVHNMINVFVAMLGAFLFTLFTLRYILPRFSKLSSGPLLVETLAAARFDAPAADRSLKIGQIGKAATDLHPTGKATFYDDIYDVVSQGDYIKKGEPVRILAVEGMRILVTGRLKK